MSLLFNRQSALQGRLGVSVKDISLDGRMITPSSPQLHRKPLKGVREILLYGSPGFARQGTVLPPAMLYRAPKQVPTALSRVTTAAAAVVLTGGYLVLASCAGSSDEGFKDGPPPKELEAEAKAQKQGGLPTVGQPPATPPSTTTPPAAGTAPASSLPSVGAAPPPGSAAPAPAAGTAPAPAKPDIVGTPTGRSIPKPTAEQQKQALTRGLIGDKAHAQYTDEEIRQIGEGEAEPARPTRQAAQTPQLPSPAVAAKATDAPVPPATPSTPVTSAPASQLPTPQPPPPAPQVAAEIPVPDPVPPPPAPAGTGGVALKRPPIVVEQTTNPPPPAVVADATQPAPPASVGGQPSSEQVILRPPPPPPSVGPRKGATSSSDPMPTPNVLQAEAQIAEATPGVISGGQVQLRPPAPYASSAPAPMYSQSQPVMVQPNAMPPMGPAVPYSFGGTQHLSSILFEHGSASLSPTDQQLIAQVASGIRATGSRLRIVGHASSRTSDMDIPSHNEANYRISMARAQAIAAVLIANGVPAQNILIEAQANGGALFFETMPSGEAGNRRADIFVDS